MSLQRLPTLCLTTICDYLFYPFSIGSMHFIEKTLSSLFGDYIEHIWNNYIDHADENYRDVISKITTLPEKYDMLCAIAIYNALDKSRLPRKMGGVEFIEYIKNMYQKSQNDIQYMFNNGFYTIKSCMKSCLMQYSSDGVRKKTFLRLFNDSEACNKKLEFCYKSVTKFITKFKHQPLNFDPDSIRYSVLINMRKGVDEDIFELIVLNFWAATYGLKLDISL
jgi:hypothetical protein